CFLANSVLRSPIKFNTPVMAPGWASPPAPGALSSTTAVSADPHQPHHQGTGDTGGWPSPPPSASSTTAPHTSIPVISPTTTSPVRRKPLPQNAAAVIPPRRSESSSSASFSGGVSPADPPIPVTSVSDVQKHSRSTLSQSSGLVPAEDPSLFVPRDLDRRVTANPTLFLATLRLPHARQPAPPLRIDTSASFIDSSDDDVGVDADYGSQFANGGQCIKRATTMPLHHPSNRPPPLHIDSSGRSMSGVVDAKNPKTPGHKISSFFGWRGTITTSPGAESSSTEVSDLGHSPLPSPMPPSLPSAVTPSTTVPFDASKGFPPRNPSLSSASILETGPSTAHVAELENELREISSELAGSIRREMELEDLVERLQSELPLDNGNQRTSDYFSDSGTSSIRLVYDGRIDDVEKYRRASEQERAQLKVDLTQRWQEERARRAAADSHVQILESQVHQLRRERVDLSDLSSRTKELEGALEATRRKLAEERQIKDNFEDLLTAMRVELEQIRNERDHLRDQMVPELKNSAASSSDTTEVQRLLEELEALKIENAALAQLQGGRFATISEDSETPSSKRNSAGGLSRSSSLARMHSKPTIRTGLSRSNSLSQSSPVTPKGVDTRESMADRMESVEAQRDALHHALRRLLDRQAYEAREYEKRIRVMELELVHAQQIGSPRKLGYEREVRNLRDEVNHLRQRAEEALDQKWQCEKGLAGLKMDLDRAEQETTSLRVLLQEHDITVPEGLGTDQEGFAEVLATSSSLESAYKQLQAEREQAEASAVQSPQEEHGQLAASVSRTESLSQHVQKQLERNNALRNRLADAIGKGEKEQQLSVVRINEMQARLKELEDTLLIAQQHAEEEMARHEEEIQQLNESHNAQLSRMKNGARSPAGLSPMPPSSPFVARSPRLDKTTSGDGISLNQAVKPEALERRVKELERLLRDADMEMGEVVSRMNRAQIEVAELQSDRDEALRQTRKLQAEIQAERDAFKALQG
ncbi:hypothetical protein AARAC_008915, partial [Aspergillus arachidicola]